MTAARKQTNLVVKAALIGLILFTCWLYFPPYKLYWVGDDYVQLGYVREFVQRPFAAYEIFHPTWTTWYYRPLQNLWILAHRLIFGLHPFAYYATQITLHGAGIALLYRLARQVKLSRFAAFCAAALFAIYGHHMDVVAWISAIAIVLMGVVSLLTISLWIDYLRRPSNGRLALTVALCLLGLLIHEGMVILPLFLVLVVGGRRPGVGDRGSGTGGQKRRFTIHHSQFTIHNSPLIAFAFLFLTLIAYVVMQLTRPNINIDPGETPAGRWLAALSPAAIAEFLAVTLDKFIFLLAPEMLSGSRGVLIGASFFFILLLWFWEGRIVTRLSLAWVALHLGFIYLALWTQRPEFYAGRHLYLPWMGLALAAGELVDRVSWPRLERRWRHVVIGAVVTAVLLGHAAVTRQAQAAWLAEREEEAAARAQLQTLLPEISPQMHIFAYRFPITPGFLRSVLHVWYDIPYPPFPSGKFSDLIAHGEATDDYFVIDYENERVYNLMPDLQERRRTVFLWSRPVRQSIVGPEGETAVQSMDLAPLEIAGPPGDRRLAILARLQGTPDNWTRHTYQVDIPRGSRLRLAWRSEPGVIYRLQIEAEGEITTLLEETAVSQEPPWVEEIIDMQLYWGKTAVLHFEAAYSGASPSSPSAHWATPNFIFD